MDPKDWLSLLIGLLGVISSAAIAYLVYSLNRQAQRAQVDKAISDSYNALMSFRAEHPEVMKLSRKWKLNNFTQMYNQPHETDKEWVYYYTYVELCLGFVNEVLYGWKSRLLDRLSFEGHYKPLVKLLLTEHEPFLSSLLPGSPYISSIIKDFRTEQEKEGWKWKDRYLALAESMSLAE